MKMTRSLLFLCLLCIFALAFPVSVSAQTATVSGKVVDDNNEPLIGASVIVKGTSIGVVTDLDGNYTLKNLNAEPVTLEFSFMGYITESVKVDLASNPAQTINAVLNEDVEQLEEVVVIGYGTQKKSDLTSAVASVSADDLEKARATSVQDALQGRAAGVQVTSNNDAGSAPRIKIRGITSINGTDPIWIIDGVQGDPNSVNAADIESMEVLKDASSAAIYGSNAANGVILVTTKKGKSGQTKVTLNIQWGILKPSSKIELASTPEYANMYREYEVLTNARKPKDFDTLGTHDYQDLIYRDALIQNYDLGVSGGNEKSTFYMGIGYLMQEGIIKDKDFERISVRLNGEHKANDWFTVGLNSNFTHRVRNGLQEWQMNSVYASPIHQAITFPVYIEPYRDQKLTESEYDEGWNGSSNTGNPLKTIGVNKRTETSNGIGGTFFAAITPVKGLKFETRISGSTGFGNTTTFNPIYYVNANDRNDVSSIEKYTSWNYSWNWQNLISYNTTLFDAHNISLLAGYEAGYSYNEFMQAERFDLINQTEEMWYFDASTNDTLLSQLPTGRAGESSGYSYLGRVSYDYKGILLAQMNIRKDYSSLFGPENRDGLFPSFSGGIKFSEFSFVKNALPFMNFGKVRYGWGRSGNNSVTAYNYYSTVGFERMYNYYITNSVSTGAAPNQAVNTAIHWEDVETSNIGVDLRFFKSKLSVSADYFKRHNNGMLMEVEVPAIAGWYVRSAYQEGGVGNPTKNIGNLSNDGVELNIGWKDNKGDFSYGTNLNLTYIKTKVGDIDPDILYAGSTGKITPITRTISNSDFDIFYGYVTDGLFRLEDTPNGDANEYVTNQPFTTNSAGEKVYAQSTAKPGDFRFKDVNGDGKITSEDMVQLGSPHPKVTLGLNLYCDYTLPGNLGAVDVSLFFQGAFGHKIFNTLKYYLSNPDGGFNWSKEYYDNHYTVDLTDRDDVVVTTSNDATATLPRIDPRGENNNLRLSDYFVEDGDYVRLKNLEIGYTLPAVLTEKAKIGSLRVYFGARNLLTYTKYSGLDPEVGSSNNAYGFSDPRSAGIDIGTYPTAKTYMLGLNVTF